MDNRSQKMIDIAKDLNKISSYIDLCGIDDVEHSHNNRASTTEILEEWDTNKDFLYKVLGSKVMVHRPISIAAPNEVICDNFSDAFNLRGEVKMNDKAFYFVHLIENHLSILNRELTEDDICGFTITKYPENESFYRCGSSLQYLLRTSCFAPICLTTNKIYVIPEYRGIELQGKNNVKIRITETLRPMKLLGKIAKSCNLEEEFEEFRLFHSRILNSTKLNGTLTLSIHPLDYMTMSDNDCGWSSCMSWKHHGDYRLGTVEMMNSPYVIVAYLESKNPMTLWFDGINSTDKNKWNNKKWRCLFLVNNNAIVKVKSYPYQCSQLETTVSNWIAQLMEENLGIKFLPDIFDLNESESYTDYGMEFLYKDVHVITNFKTNHMYNDFSQSSKSICQISENYAKRIEECASITITEVWDYSGAAQCMWCGQRHNGFSEDYQLVCDDEISHMYCCNCEASVYEDEAYYDIDGNVYCEDCWNEQFVTDLITEEAINRNEANKIYFIYKDIFDKLIKLKDKSKKIYDIDCFYLSNFLLNCYHIPVGYINDYNLFNNHYNLDDGFNNSLLGIEIHVGINTVGNKFYYCVYDSQDIDASNTFSFLNNAEYYLNLKSMISYINTQQGKMSWNENMKYYFNTYKNQILHTTYTTNLYDLCFPDGLFKNNNVELLNSI